MNSGYLTHRILDPKILAQYLEAVEDDLEETAQAFEPVFTNVYQYYGNSLISFTNIIDDLLLQLLILIKLKVQVPMSLFSIETVPVPLDAETYLGEKREYTQIIPETKLIALTENNYITLMQAQISLCAKIGYMYYCEYAHLLKKHMKHTCMSAICHASARPPAFLSTMPHIPSSLEGTRNRKDLNGYHSCSRSMVIKHRPLNQTPPSCYAAKSQPIRSFPAIEPGMF